MYMYQYMLALLQILVISRYRFITFITCFYPHLSIGCYLLCTIPLWNNQVRYHVNKYYRIYIFTGYISSYANV